MAELIFSHTPLWEQHHAQSIEIALKLNKKNKKVFFFNLFLFKIICISFCFKLEIFFEFFYILKSLIKYKSAIK